MASDRHRQSQDYNNHEIRTGATPPEMQQAAQQAAETSQPTFPPPNGFAIQYRHLETDPNFRLGSWEWHGLYNAWRRSVMDCPHNEDCVFEAGRCILYIYNYTNGFQNLHHVSKDTLPSTTSPQQPSNGGSSQQQQTAPQGPAQRQPSGTNQPPNGGQQAPAPPQVEHFQQAPPSEEAVDRATAFEREIEAILRQGEEEKAAAKKARAQARAQAEAQGSAPLTAPSPSQARDQKERATVSSPARRSMDAFLSAPAPSRGRNSRNEALSFLSDEDHDDDEEDDEDNGEDDNEDGNVNGWVDSDEAAWRFLLYGEDEKYRAARTRYLVRKIRELTEELMRINAAGAEDQHDEYDPADESFHADECDGEAVRQNCPPS